MKKYNALALSLMVLMQSFTMNVSADNTSKKNDDNNHTLKIVTKFSIPITVCAGLIIGGGYTYHKYKHRTRKIYITGDVTKEKLDKAFQEAEQIKKANHNCKLIFQNATVKKEMFQNRYFHCDVLFTGQCTIEAGACTRNQTAFYGNFEIDGSITEGSSFYGAAFMYKDIIVKGKIPQELFKGAVVVPDKEKPGAKYRLPGKPEIVLTKQNLEATQEYLKVYFK